MATDLQLRNAEHTFRLWDTNDDGRVTWADFQAVADRYSDAMGSAKGSDAHVKTTDWLRAAWASMAVAADKNDNDEISVEEYRTMYGPWLGTPDYEAGLQEFGVWLLELCDRNHDGIISLDDYQGIATVFRLDASQMREAFDKIDTDNDGRISTEEYSEAIHQFANPVTGNEPGNWIFGRPG